MPMGTQQRLQTTFTAALVTVARRGNPPGCRPGMNEEIKERPIHAAEYYSPIKRNEVLIHATTCMNFKNMMLFLPQNKTQKATGCTIPRIGNVPAGPSRETESTLVVARGWVRWNEEGLLMAKGFPLEVVKMFWNQTKVAQRYRIVYFARELCMVCGHF